MEKSIGSSPGRQEKANAYFDTVSSFWKSIYASGDVYAEVHRNRHTRVLDWVDSLGLAPGSQVLEVGCGAGLMAVALAQRGLRVHAIDSVEAMVQQASQHMMESGTAELLSVEIGDARTLAFEDNSFDLVLALGVLPWAEQPEFVVQEMARVTKPEGYVILTADNRRRLTHLLDPLLLSLPMLSSLKRRIQSLLTGARPSQRADVYNSTYHNSRFVDEILVRANLVKTRGITLGFGPFTFFRFKFVPEPFGTRLHHWLQHFADQNVPVLRSTGAQYIVQAKKSLYPTLVQSTNTRKAALEATETSSSRREIINGNR